MGCVEVWEGCREGCGVGHIGNMPLREIQVIQMIQIKAIITSGKVARCQAANYGTINNSHRVAFSCNTSTSMFEIISVFLTVRAPRE